MLAMAKQEPESTINRNGPDSAEAAVGFRTTRTRLPSARHAGRLCRTSERVEGLKIGESSGKEKRISLWTTLDFVLVGRTVHVQALENASPCLEEL